MGESAENPTRIILKYTLLSVFLDVLIFLWLSHRWQYCRHGKLHSTSTVTLEVKKWSMHSAWCRVYSAHCSPQFSALFPEMVDAVILLDAFGFIPTDPVIAQYYQYSANRGMVLQLSVGGKKIVFFPFWLGDFWLLNIFESSSCRARYPK